MISVPLSIGSAAPACGSAATSFPDLAAGKSSSRTLRATR